MAHVARMGKDLIVFLIPVIEAVPVERNVLADLGRAGWRRVEPPCRILDHSIAHPEVVEGPLTEGRVRLRPIGRFEQIGPKVAAREVVDGQAHRDGDTCFESATATPPTNARTQRALGSTRISRGESARLLTPMS